MSKREQLLGVIEQDLAADLADYRALVEHMQALYERLLARDCPGIDALNAQIEPLLEAARGRAQRRSKVLAAFGLGTDAVAMSSLIDNLPPARAREVGRHWQALGALAGQCKALNGRNGQLLAMHHEILEHLLGQANPAQLYAQTSY